MKMQELEDGRVKEKKKEENEAEQRKHTNYSTPSGQPYSFTHYLPIAMGASGRCGVSCVSRTGDLESQNKSINKREMRNEEEQ